MKIPYIESILNGVIRLLIRLVCRIEDRELDKIPVDGPAILATNHTTNFEGPIYYVMLRGSRDLTALAKRELWSNPLTRFMMQIWGIIPLNRRGPDRRAMYLARSVLSRGHFLGIAPEGTRSSSGKLQRGRPGAAMIATAARVPIIPMVQWGVQDLRSNLSRFRRTPLHFRVGAPFYLNIAEGDMPTAKQLRAMADEIMYQLAVLLPERLRGYYRNLSEMTTHYIRPIGDEVADL